MCLQLTFDHRCLTCLRPFASKNDVRRHVSKKPSHRVDREEVKADYQEAKEDIASADADVYDMENYSFIELPAWRNSDNVRGT